MFISACLDMELVDTNPSKNALPEAFIGEIATTISIPQSSYQMGSDLWDWVIWANDIED